MTPSIDVVINGEARNIPGDLAVSGLIAHLGLPPGRVAVERNLGIVPRSQWGSTVVENGDRFEIVQLVGGG